MSRRRKTVDDLDALLPSEMIESSGGGATVAELKSIVTQLESQMEEMIGKYEKKITDLNDRLESIETDFKQVVEALGGSGGGGGPPAPPG